MSNAWPQVFDAVSRIIKEKTGNILIEDKHLQMVVNRISKRFVFLKVKNEQEYLNYLNANKAEESEALTSLLTTHHTFFMREFTHFDFIIQNLEQIVKNVKASGRSQIDIWSAAASYGHEAYSLAMILKTHLPSVDPQMKFRIIGTDIAAEAIKVAKNGVYRFSDLKSVASQYITKNWQKGTGDIAEFVRASETIRSHCDFRVANLVDHQDPIYKQKFDIIMCRNVFIYFDSPTVEKVVKKQVEQLNENGYLISGVTESLSQYNIPLKSMGHSIYHKSTAAKPAATSPQKTTSKAKRILCVDDSPLILKLLTKVFSADGFEIVGTAADGEEAYKKMQELKPDAMTLDVHMPVLDGLGYLQKYHSKAHPPVIIVSSVSYEDGDMIPNLYKAGAYDFVEKPQLSNITKVGEEIKNKIKIALSGAPQVIPKEAIAKELDLKKSASKDFEGCLQIILGGPSKLLSEAINVNSPWDHLIIPIGQGIEIQKIAAQFMMDGFTSVGVNSNEQYPKAQLVISDIFNNQLFDKLNQTYRKIAVTIVGQPNISQVAELSDLGWHITVEDVYGEDVEEYTHDVVPRTSFHYHARKAFLNWHRVLDNVA